MTAARKHRLPIVLTIAGSDAGGLAGMQADLRTFAALGVQGVSAVTAITAQNSLRVCAVRLVPAAMVVAQLEAIRADFAIAAVKIGMLGSAANVRAVAGWLRAHAPAHVVLDPVLIATSGRRLLSASAISVLRDELLPLSSIVTPNIPEAEALLGHAIDTAHGLPAAAAALRGRGASAVLLKGGHCDANRANVVDHLADARGAARFTHARLPYGARGTGCTLASAIAAGLARKRTLRRAVADAEAYLQRCYRRARPVGSGDARALQHD